MGGVRLLNSLSAMASPWRRRRMCMLLGSEAAPAALREVSATGAMVETAARLRLGERVELRHPEAGTIHGSVHALADEGLFLTFPATEASVAFALAAIAADMSRPA